MNTNKLIGACYCCSIPGKINSLDLAITNINRQLEKILYKNNLTMRELRCIREGASEIHLHPTFYKVNIHQSCGCCRDHRYNSFKSKENITLTNVCNFLKYILYTKHSNINLHELKNSCRGYYSRLYHSIEKVEYILQSSNKTAITQ